MSLKSHGTLSVLLLVIVLCSPLGAGWSLINPVGNENYDDNQVVNGSGVAPDPNDGAWFTFEQQNPTTLDWEIRGSNINVESYAFMGMEMWQSSLDPADQTANGSWPFSYVQNGVVAGDYKSRIDDGTTNAEARNQSVIGLY